MAEDEMVVLRAVRRWIEMNPKHRQIDRLFDRIRFHLFDIEQIAELWSDLKFVNLSSKFKDLCSQALAQSMVNKNKCLRRNRLDEMREIMSFSVFNWQFECQYYDSKTTQWIKLNIVRLNSSIKDSVRRSQVNLYTGE
ncbi:hypothetical protein Ciccas_010472 [Cichlidogyrus casuarinus]|uniref:BACK domain-containing protein n=1 Tax=Cichlidogyrus casuarinus TaxID=1844966 RepID=A0ABD2PVN0_9PLAT